MIIFNFRRSYSPSKFSSLISTERSDVADHEEDIYNLKQILQSRNNFYARMPRDSFQRTSRRLDHQTTTHSVIPIDPLVPTFDISFEDWLGESGETPVTSREEFSYPQLVL